MRAALKVALIVACDKNHVIGKGNALPWHLPADLQYFKCVTLGKPIIMGRKTYESIGRLLPGRPNIIVTRQAAWQPPAGAYKAMDLADAISLAGELAATADEVMIIGGEQIYRAALDYANRVYKTEVDICIDQGDAFFPVLPSDQWREVSRHEGDAGAPLHHAFVILERVE
ncbi:MAG TPA: dihydrofolate reductase [Cellvibrionaceae bacterium]